MRLRGNFLIIVFMVLLGVFSFHNNSVLANDSASTETTSETALAKTAPTPKVVAIDTNNDGKPDQWQYYENGQVVRTEADTDFDGKVDEIGHYSNSKLVKVEKDSHHSGKMDTWVTY